MKWFFLLLLFSYSTVQAQYTDYVGAGHNNGIVVSSSNEQSKTDWSEIATASNTINGQGLDARLLETSRFLAQATFGTDLDYIQTVSEDTFENWIDTQFTIASPTSLGDLTTTIYNDARTRYFDNGGVNAYAGPNASHFSYAWWESNTGNSDLLRQRVALALSQIFSFSNKLESENYGEGSGYFYDILLDNAFGNYEDLLMDITLQPMMSNYLTFYKNPKSNSATNQFPDENYAREIMQLFTIGLYKLNTDGSYILDANNNRIPTYSNDDIAEFAKVFTGLSAGGGLYGVAPSFDLDFSLVDQAVPLTMYDAYHEPGQKFLLDGYIIPAGQTGMQDVTDAVHHLFNHPNTGPFVALRLIQRLVKSNPSPQYIEAVANAFNDTNGVRGDMKAVIKAILLHPEARSCSWINNPNQGKLREPMIKYFNLMRQITKINPSNKNWNTGDDFLEFTYQGPLKSNSIFNFYYPDFEPNGAIADAGLVGPEYQILDSYTSIGFLNLFDSYIYEQNPLYGDQSYLGLLDVTFDFSQLQYYAKDSEVLINYLDKLFTNGQLSNDTRIVIKTAIASFTGTDAATRLTKSKIALWLILISPDYAIIK